MAPFELKYAGERRQAIFRARFEQGMTYKRIAELAAIGVLTPGDPFLLPPEYAGDLCRAEEARRRGRFASPLAEMPHRDALEELRRACIGVADDLLSDLRAIGRKSPGKVDPRRLQEAIKAVTLAAAIPARGEPIAERVPRQRSGAHPNRTGPVAEIQAGARELKRSGTLMRALRSETPEPGTSEAGAGEPEPA